VLINVENFASALPWRSFPAGTASYPPTPFFHGPVSTSFFLPRKEMVLLFMNVVLSSVKPMTGQRSLWKRTDPPGQKDSRRLLSKTNGALIELIEKMV